MAGTASIRTLAVKIETFTNEVCVPDFGLTFPVLAGNFLPFLSRTEVGGLIASFGHTLRARGCRCELIEKATISALVRNFAGDLSLYRPRYSGHVHPRPSPSLEHGRRTYHNLASGSRYARRIAQIVRV